MRPIEYDDGLDADGYPIESTPMPRYRHGQEEAAPAFQPFSSLHGRWMDRLQLAAELSKHTESPIETMMGLALHECFAGEEVQIVPQFKWRKYRADWALLQKGKPPVFVECDGNEFHTKPEDVDRDRLRDAMAAKTGIKTFRFTGSEIYRDPKGCAIHVWLGMVE